jgi:hypothetical protein
MLEPSVVSSEPRTTAGAAKLAGVSGWALAAMFGFVVFLLWGTGLATDEYVFLLQALTQPISKNWWPTTLISMPVLHYAQALPYFVIGDRVWAYDVLKAVYTGAGVYFASCFFRIFCLPRRALLLGFMFVFLPLDDAVVFTDLYLVIAFTCYLYAYALGHKGRLGWSVLFAFIGSFSSYGSPPMALGLAALALMQKQRRLAGALLIPNLIYIAYYLFTSLVLKVGTQRLTGELSVTALVKQSIVQITSFLDASIGPSAWAKIAYSIGSLDELGWFVAPLAAIAAVYYIAGERRTVADRRLIAAASIILVGSFGMFALTGLYPQMAFSLGDRVMIYGGFFLICLLASMRLPRAVESGIVVVLVLAIVGIATHWKQWAREVDQVAANIRTNESIRSLPAGTLLYVSGHQYSRLGPYSHIDFFTANYVVQTFFKLQLGPDTALDFASFNRRLVFKDGVLSDRKYGDAAPVNGGIWLYNSNSNTLEYLDAVDIQKQLDALPEDIRHWTQQLKGGRIDALITRLSPSLRYAYPSPR